ncbi:NRPS condensation-like uncharacterized protein [Streptomyces demainii]|uniref:NRPS condensation-like uncharacterized protein n=1 Tax=Streptomyces demainii TaxID=588122 RepID=A0ABT9L6M9_9ACTN|nr:NRPS condensation-like uncharacterized protein [Streptomyces demainii]
MDRLQPNSSLYNIPLAFRICGALDIPVLRASLLEIVRRHDVLRTRFPDEEGVPGQVVEPHADVPLPVHDLSGFPESEREAESERRLQTEADAPFSLADGPLLRASLLRLADQEHVLLLVFHHIVFDGGSRAVLVTELEALYAAGLRREKADLPSCDCGTPSTRPGSGSRTVAKRSTTGGAPSRTFRPACNSPWSTTARPWRPTPVPWNASPWTRR